MNYISFNSLKSWLIFSICTNKAVLSAQNSAGDSIRGYTPAPYLIESSVSNIHDASAG